MIGSFVSSIIFATVFGFTMSLAITSLALEEWVTPTTQPNYQSSSAQPLLKANYFSPSISHQPTPTQTHT